jgi:3-methylcrotonyl-CoA carboxylase alpha subunit
VGRSERLEAGRVKTTRLSSGGRTEEIGLGASGEASLGGRPVPYAREDAGGGVARLTAGGTAHRILALRDGDRVWVWCDGSVHVFDRARRARSGADHGADLSAPMPGLVRRVFAAPGKSVARGAVLVALEAMKMEHAIRAPRDGVVRRVLVREGDLVDAGAELVELEPAPP